MSDRTDEQRIMAGVPVDVEAGPTPGAVAQLRVYLRSTAGELTGVERRLRVCRDEMTALLAEQAIYREACDEVMDAICFRGMPLGLSHLAPTMSLDALTASLPIHPEDDPTTGIGSPGFSVRFYEGDAR